ncbi:MAG: aspartate/glutamate racemase family protein [Pseudomonadota bacterium]
MKTIGILGGMSAASTQLYYRELCAETRRRLGGLHSPELLIRSVDFAEVEALQMNGRWAEAGAMLNQEAHALVRGGAELLLLATNTMHKLAAEMMTGIEVPFLHIAQATAHAISQAGLRTPGLLATAFTMEEPFYRAVLEQQGLSPLIPEPQERSEVHRIIYDELCQEQILASSQARFIEIATALKTRGADGLILGCTEVGLLLNQDNVPLPVFDSTLVHCHAALDLALAQDP